MPYIEFTKPWALALFALFIPAIYWYLNSIAGMEPIRKKTAVILRSIIFTALILAIAGIQIKFPVKNLSVLFLVDSSLSISHDNREWALNYVQDQLKQMPPGDQAGIILFGKDAYMEENFSGRKKIGTFTTIIDPAYTDISRALQLASAVFPESTVKRVVLISDGNENLGDARRENELLSARGVELFCIPYPSEKHPEVLLARVEAPLSASIDSPFAIKIEVESNTDTTGTLRLFCNNNLAAMEKVEIYQGKNLFTVTQTIKDPGNFRYKASIETHEDKFPDNNQSETIVTAIGKPRVLHLSSHEAHEKLLGKALMDQKIQVIFGGLDMLPGDLAEIAGYDAVIFNNIDGLALSPVQMQMIENYVRDAGGGFIMVGGDRSFGAGGYYKTPVARILPVSLDIKKKKNLPSVAMVLCIDKSGSMTESTGKDQKMVLAREAAMATAQLMGPKDKIGVIAFDHAAKWVSPLEPATDKKEISKKIASIRAGGGTSIYPALTEAHEALRNENAIVKHVIVLTDGRSAPADFQGISADMMKDKITISTVGVGSDTDIPFLEELAKMGQGRFYFADQASMLPQIFVRETFLAGKSAIIEEPFYPVYYQPAEFLEGMDQKQWPILQGYVATSTKPMATTSLFTNNKDPLLAYWRTGLGKSAAFTSDDGLRWGKEWIAWPEYRRFWVQMVRWAMSGPDSDRLNVDVDMQDGKVRVIVDAMDEEGKPLNFLPLSAKVITPSGKPGPLNIEQISVGRYSGEFNPGEVGTYVINVNEEKKEGSYSNRIQAFTIPYSPEYNSLKTNHHLLSRLAQTTGGRVLDKNNNVFVKSGTLAYYPKTIWQELLILALFLLPFDVAVRRVYLPKDLFAKTKSWFEKREEAKEDISLERVQSLKAVKDGLREKYTIPEKTPQIRIKEFKPPSGGTSQNLSELQSKLGPAKAPPPVEKIRPDGEKASTLSELKKVKKQFRKKNE